MRNFSEDEKAILKQIVAPHTDDLTESILRSIIVYNLFDELSLKLNIIVKFDKTKKVALFVTDRPGTPVNLNDDDWPTQERHKEYWDQLFILQYYTVMLLSLIKYLEANYYIYTYQLNGDSMIIINKECKFNLKYRIGESEFFNDKIPGGIFENIEKLLFPTPELVEFVKNGFKDKEQLRHDENFILQKRSLKVAIALGITSILIAVIPLVVPNSYFSYFFTSSAQDNQAKQLHLEKNKENIQLNPTSKTVVVNTVPTIFDNKKEFN